MGRGREERRGEMEEMDRREVKGDDAENKECRRMMRDTRPRRKRGRGR